MPDLLSADRTTILLYGDVGDPWCWGDGFTAAQVAEALASHGAGDVLVRLNSGGGSAFEGMAIYSLFKAHEGQVTIAIDGIAASAASLIAMAGGRIEMRDGAMMMIHEAASITFGDAAEHEKVADTLDRLSANYASVYARRSGKSAEDVRALMIEETWMSADDAIALGFATAKIAEAPATAALFPYTVYAKAPDSMRAALRPVPAKAPAAAAANPGNLAHKETVMPNDNPAVVVPPVAPTPAQAALPVAAAAPVAKAWAADFFILADKAGVSLAQANEIVAAAVDVNVAKDNLINAIAARQAGQVPAAAGGRAVVTADGRDKYIAGIAQAVMAQTGIEKFDPKNEFNGVKPMDIVREVLAQNGLKVGRDPMKMVAAAITGSSGDFSQITSNIAEKAMLKGYEETAETFAAWTSVGSLSDFKQARRVDLNAMPSLPKLTENLGYSYLQTGDRGELISLVTAGGLFSVSRQAIINDDLDVFAKIPMRLGRAAKRTVGNDVYAVLTANPTMGDGVALFHATHKNLATGGGSAFGGTSLQAMDLAMGKQTDRSQTKVVLNLKPKHLIIPRALKFTAYTTLRSSSLDAANPAIVNPVQNIVDSVIEEARLDSASATAWYATADQSQTDTVEVAYLNGNQSPFLESDRPFDVDGMAWKVRLDYAVKALAFEGMYKAAGA